eukprot:CAMPEP_0183745118 /NCGR_PEP_ID=MMETSP0737-20130205/66077_1 /TAXON_ID=385413 /ORGANISM="Thalassiosira miniscula, Strain CCMP1093" /LENGTH=939 /DNA_ID=CAMNT_0025980777 /DNA_START=42 /DNA_END=2864 /DNA_ORIENTATION=-
MINNLVQKESKSNAKRMLSEAIKIFNIEDDDNDSASDIARIGIHGPRRRRIRSFFQSIVHAKYHSQQQQQQQPPSDSLFEDIFENNHGSSSSSSSSEVQQDVIHLPPYYNDDAPPFSDFESIQDRARRMEMARELQKVFYKDAASTSTTASSGISSTSSLLFDSSNTIGQHDSSSTSSTSSTSNNKGATTSSSSSSSPSSPSGYNRILRDIVTSSLLFDSSNTIGQHDSSSTSSTSTSNNKGAATSSSPSSPSGYKDVPYGSSILRNLPTLTTSDGIRGADASALLPGYQFVWNVHHPQHCHMFHSVLSGPAPWYFAHVCLPSSSSFASKKFSSSAKKNDKEEEHGEKEEEERMIPVDTFSSSAKKNDKEEEHGEKEEEERMIPVDTFQSYNDLQYELKQSTDGKPLYGTLLRITDRRFRDEDGRIVLAVQAVDRLRVHDVSSAPGSFLCTDVQLSPEEELMRMHFDKAVLSSASYLSIHDSDSDHADSSSDDALLSHPSAVSGAARAAAITDRRFRDEDGRIVLAVQAVDRLRVHDVSSAPGSFLCTDVQLSPEEELMRMHFDKALLSSASYLSSHGHDSSNADSMTEDALLSHPSAVSGAARAAAAADAFRVRKFEFLPVFLEEKPRAPSGAVSSSLRSNPNDSAATRKVKDAIRRQEEDEASSKKKDAGPEYINVVQLVNYDAFAYSSLGKAEAATSQALKTYWEEMAKESSTAAASASHQDTLTEDNMFLGDGVGTTNNPSSSTSFFLPEPSSSTAFSGSTPESVETTEYHVWTSLDEMMRLLSMAASSSVPLPSQLLGLLPKRSDWPHQFVLEDYARSLSTSGRSIGTTFKSPFVRVDRIASSSGSGDYPLSYTSSSTTYSSLRRAQRLSYAIWLLLDGLAMSGARPSPPPRHEVLAMNSVEERLRAARETLEGINFVLKKMIPENRKGKEDEK